VNTEAAVPRFKVRSRNLGEDAEQPAALRNQVDVLRVQARRGGARLGVDERRLGADGDRLGDAGQLQREIDGELLTERHDRVGDLRRDEALKAGADLVGAWREGREPVSTLLV